MDSIPELGRCVLNPESGRCLRDQQGRLVMNSSADWRVNSDYGTNTIRHVLRAAMDRGYLFVSYNGHANARLMTHEYVFPTTDVRETFDLGNIGRPFVFMDMYAISRSSFG
jgi:hypothetical protein